MEYIYGHPSDALHILPCIRSQEAAPGSLAIQVKGVLPMDKLIETLALIATIKAIDLFTSWLKEKNR